MKTTFIRLAERFRRWPLTAKLRTLRVYAILWVILPLALLMFGVIAVGIFAYQQVLTNVLIERQRQIAITAAVSVSEVIDGYARLLEALAGNPDLLNRSIERRTSILEGAADALEVFNGGVMILDGEGNLLTSAPASGSTPGLRVPQGEIFVVIRDRLGAVFSNVLTDLESGEHLILVGVPILDEEGDFDGALLGAVNVRRATLSRPIERLTMGMNGIAYLVDQRGKVIFHPDPEEIGADYGDRPFLQQVTADGSSGMLWRSPTGERLFEGDAPVTAAGWELIVQEPWDLAIAPARVYSLVVVLLGVLAVLLVVLVSWRGVHRLVAPIHLLGEQTGHLTRGEPLEVFTETGIIELDRLERAFDEMARQITAYRAGLRRYVEAITRLQEDERRRISRELHDETIQNLLAISRRLELVRTSDSDPHHHQQLQEVQAVVSETLSGIRQISRSLRPLMLEDLGLIPALKTLVRALRQEEGALPHAELKVTGEPVPLTSDEELTLYRITQEALTNIRKHAQATGAWVELAFESDRINLEIADNGKGFKAPDVLAEFTQAGCFGLMGIQERVWTIGGSLSIFAEIGQGTRLCVSIPTEKASR